MKQHISMSGQFRLVKKSKDGEVLFDSGKLNNLLLDTGLDYFCDDTGYSNILSYLGIGLGNSEPRVSQNRLDNVLQIKLGYHDSKKDDYDKQQDGEYFTAIRTYKYRFDNLNNVNISELGLVSGTSTDDYIAYTRALIKDEQGRPLTITVLKDEILDIFYSLKQVFHLQDKQFKLLLSDGCSGNRGYVDCLMRLANIGGGNLGNGAFYGKCVGEKLTSRLEYNTHFAYDNQTLGDFTGVPQGRSNWINGEKNTTGNYVARSYKNTVTLHIGTSINLPQLGSMILFTTMGFYQISFTNDDGSMIDKNNTRTFSITLEISWGRDTRD